MNIVTYLMYRFIYRNVRATDQAELYSNAARGLASPGLVDIGGLGEQYCEYFERRFKVDKNSEWYRSYTLTGSTFNQATGGYPTHGGPDYPY